MSLRSEPARVQDDGALDPGGEQPALQVIGVPLVAVRRVIQ